MSERDGVRLWAAITILAILVFLTSVINLSDWTELRDLQRRVGQLESERR